MKKKMAKEPERHGWENHNEGYPPFDGAAHPIHVMDGGKYFRGKGKHKDQKKYDKGGDCP